MGVTAQLSVRNGREAVAFYIKAFGTRLVYQIGETDDAPPIMAEPTLEGTSF